MRFFFKIVTVIFNRGWCLVIDTLWYKWLTPFGSITTQWFTFSTVKKYSVPPSLYQNIYIHKKIAFLALKWRFAICPRDHKLKSYWCYCLAFYSNTSQLWGSACTCRGGTVCSLLNMAKLTTLKNATHFWMSDIIIILDLTVYEVCLICCTLEITNYNKR